MKLTRTQYAYKRLGYSGSEIAADYMAELRSRESCLSKIRGAVDAFHDEKSPVCMADVVELANDFRNTLRANGITAKGKLGYFADQANKWSQKKHDCKMSARQTGDPSQYVKFDLVRMVKDDAPESDAPDGDTDSAGRQSSDTEAGRGVDHEVMADTLAAWRSAGAEAETILGHLLDVSIPAEKQVAFLRDVADRLEQRQSLPNPNGMESAIAGAVCNS